MKSMSFENYLMQRTVSTERLVDKVVRHGNI